MMTKSLYVYFCPLWDKDRRIFFPSEKGTIKDLILKISCLRDKRKKHSCFFTLEHFVPRLLLSNITVGDSTLGAAHNKSIMLSVEEQHMGEAHRRCVESSTAPSWPRLSLHTCGGVWSWMEQKPRRSPHLLLNASFPERKAEKRLLGFTLTVQTICEEHNWNTSQDCDSVNYNLDSQHLGVDIQSYYDAKMRK